ncbi:MAG TPA: hypothetical protein VKB39_04220 [Candidatus Baltobacteraceae bacterium]|nr:hypothetical protein [Candidatus Baltobacteraceae bacterium]
MRTRNIFAAAALACATACTGMGGGHAIPQTPYQPSALFAPEAGSGTSVLKTLKKHVTIGSTVDPTNGDVNPYGLAISGKRLYACNFNASSNVQGTGTTIVSLSTTPGSAPKHVAGDSSLLGCSSLAMTQQGHGVYATGSLAKAINGFCVSGKGCGGPGNRFSNITGKNVVRPWGAAWELPPGPYEYASKALFVSDATTGSIILAVYCPPQATCESPMTPIVTGFKVNKGKPGNILGPSGLAFDPKNCVKIGRNAACGTLYVVDGANNTVVAIHNVMNLRAAKSIVVGKNGTSFSGPQKSWASLVYSGKPLVGPISSALLYNGNLVVGNTLEPKGTNSLVEIAPAKCAAVPCKPGAVVAKVNVDKGPPGALFGIAAAGSGKSVAVYFNDDNKNNVQALLP